MCSFFWQYRAIAIDAHRIWGAFHSRVPSGPADQKSGTERRSLIGSSGSHDADGPSPSQCSPALPQPHSVAETPVEGTPANCDCWAQICDRIPAAGRVDEQNEEVPTDVNQIGAGVNCRVIMKRNGGKEMRKKMGREKEIESLKKAFLKIECK